MFFFRKVSLLYWSCLPRVFLKIHILCSTLSSPALPAQIYSRHPNIIPKNSVYGLRHYPGVFIWRMQVHWIAKHRWQRKARVYWISWMIVCSIVQTQHIDI
jgi:hypothetical protein